MSPHRFGPRQIRAESTLLRAYNSGTRAAPYESLMVADIGDVNVNVYDLKDTCKRIRDAFKNILAPGCIPLTMGESKRQHLCPRFVIMKITWSMSLLCGMCEQRSAVQDLCCLQGAIILLRTQSSRLLLKSE